MDVEQGRQEAVWAVTRPELRSQTEEAQKADHGPGWNRGLGGRKGRVRTASAGTGPRCRALSRHV